MSGIMSMLLGAVSSAAAAADEFFNRVTLLLNTGSTNGAQNNTFLDSGTANGGVGFTITRNGNTTQGTFTPFSQTGWSNFCATAGTDYLNLGSNANFSFGTGAYTIEFFVYRTANGSTDSVFASIEASGTGWYVSTNLNAGVALNLRGSGAVLSTNSYQIPLNTWTHVVVTRASTSANQTRIFINGVLAIAGTDANNWSATGSLLLMNTGVGGYNAAGYLSNVRLIKGSIPTAYQTSSTTAGTSVFTSPTTALTTSSQGATSGNISLLTCQDNRFIDNSATAATITLTGTPSVQAFSPFAPTAAYDSAVVGGSGYFDGTGDYLSVPDNAAFTMGAGDFCLEAWVYVTAASGAQAIYGTSNSAGSQSSMSFLLYAQNSSGFPAIGVGYAGTMYYATSSEALTKNQWNHIAGVRNGATVSIYVNGVSRGTLNMAALAITDSTEIVGIGRNGNYNGEYLTGYIASARIIKGSPVYTANFTPPTAPLTAITNTQLLTNFTNAGIFDAAAKNDLETVGNAQVSTTQAKFGTTSMYFDGTGDYLTLPVSKSFEFGSANWTIEFWLYVPSLPSTRKELLYLNANSSGYAAVALHICTNNKLGLSFSESGGSWKADDTTGVGSALTAATWQYVAVTRSGQNIQIYLDGTAQGAAYTTTAATTSLMTTYTLNQIATYNTSSFQLNGYMDELRITIGQARTVTSVPTAAFPIQ
jgi:hypothetical protein